jgi:hypothetical protein
MRYKFKQAIRNNPSNKNEILQKYVQTQSTRGQTPIPNMDKQNKTRSPEIRRTNQNRIQTEKATINELEQNP